MTNFKKPILIILSGPNGAGKTTFYNQIAAQNPILSDAVFLNYDNEVARLKTMPEYTQAYQTIQQKIHFQPSNNAYHIPTSVMPDFSKSVHQIISDIKNLQTATKHVYRQAMKNIRAVTHDAFTNSKNIIFETTTSGGTIKKLARQYDYNICGFYICVLGPEISVSRVQHRVKNGGHNIPHKVILWRYSEHINVLPSALSTGDASFVIDNSHKNRFTPVFAISDNHLIDISPCPEYLQHIRAHALTTHPSENLGDILGLTDDINIQNLTAEQRRAFIHITLSKLFEKLK